MRPESEALHPNWKALIEWGKRHPYGSIDNLQLHEGVPHVILTPSGDGVGHDKVLVNQLVKTYGISKESTNGH
jgi:hypothetical protein